MSTHSTAKSELIENLENLQKLFKSRKESIQSMGPDKLPSRASIKVIFDYLESSKKKVKEAGIIKDNKLIPQYQNNPLVKLIVELSKDIETLYEKLPKIKKPTDVETIEVVTEAPSIELINRLKSNIKSFTGYDIANNMVTKAPLVTFKNLQSKNKKPIKRTKHRPRNSSADTPIDSNEAKLAKLLRSKISTPESLKENFKRINELLESSLDTSSTQAKSQKFFDLLDITKDFSVTNKDEHTNIFKELINGSLKKPNCIVILKKILKYKECDYEKIFCLNHNGTERYPLLQYAIDAGAYDAFKVMLEHPGFKYSKDVAESEISTRENVSIINFEKIGAPSTVLIYANNRSKEHGQSDTEIAPEDAENLEQLNYSKQYVAERLADNELGKKTREFLLKRFANLNNNILDERPSNTLERYYRYLYDEELVSTLERYYTYLDDLNIIEKQYLAEQNKEIKHYVDYLDKPMAYLALSFAKSKNYLYSFVPLVGYRYDKNKLENLIQDAQQEYDNSIGKVQKGEPPENEQIKKIKNIAQENSFALMANEIKNYKFLNTTDKVEKSHPAIYFSAAIAMGLGVPLILGTLFSITPLSFLNIAIFSAAAGGIGSIYGLGTLKSEFTKFKETVTFLSVASLLIFGGVALAANLGYMTSFYGLNPVIIPIAAANVGKLLITLGGFGIASYAMSRIPESIWAAKGLITEIPSQLIRKATEYFFFQGKAKDKFFSMDAALFVRFTTNAIIALSMATLSSSIIVAVPSILLSIALKSGADYFIAEEKKGDQKELLPIPRTVASVINWGFTPALIAFNFFFPVHAMFSKFTLVGIMVGVNSTACVAEYALQAEKSLEIKERFVKFGSTALAWTSFPLLFVSGFPSSLQMLMIQANIRMIGSMYSSNFNEQVVKGAGYMPIPQDNTKEQSFFKSEFESLTKGTWGTFRYIIDSLFPFTMYWGKMPSIDNQKELLATSDNFKKLKPDNGKHYQAKLKKTEIGKEKSK